MRHDMNLESLRFAVQAHHPVVIVLQADDYAQLQRAMPATPGEWNKERMTCRGAPIVRSEFRHSYLVEDTPDGPFIYMLV